MGFLRNATPASEADLSSRQPADQRGAVGVASDRVEQLAGGSLAEGIDHPAAGVVHGGTLPDRQKGRSEDRPSAACLCP